LAAYEVLRNKWTVMDVSAVEWLGARAGQTELLESLEEELGADVEENRFEDAGSVESSSTTTAQSVVNA
jgi:hypothetical protein